jgi:hypothetical protein
LRAAWQPWLFDLITPRQDRLEGIKLVLDLLNGAGGLITILFALGMWLSGRGEKTAPASRLDEILVPTTPDKLFETYVVPARVRGQVLPWIDTGTVTTADLRASQVLVIAGPMKSGKSREAIELLWRAMDDGIVSTARLYDVSESWRRLPPDALRAY